MCRPPTLATHATTHKVRRTAAIGWLAHRGLALSAARQPGSPEAGCAKCAIEPRPSRKQSASKSGEARDRAGSEKRLSHSRPSSRKCGVCTDGNEGASHDSVLFSRARVSCAGVSRARRRRDATGGTAARMTLQPSRSDFRSPRLLFRPRQEAKLAACACTGADTDVRLVITAQLFRQPTADTF